MRIMGRYKYVEGLETLHFVNLTREERSAFNKHGRLHGSVPVLSLWQYYSGGLPVSKILSSVRLPVYYGDTGLRGLREIRGYEGCGATELRGYRATRATGLYLYSHLMFSSKALKL